MPCGVDGLCDDGNPCTSDVCGPDGSCQSFPNRDDCDDGDPCTVDDVCRAGVCGGAPMPCDDDDPCTEATCDAGACVYTDVTGACDDGDACTTGDTCSAGACVGTRVLCDDGNECTDDVCVDGDCVHDANADACDDGDACTTGDVCDRGVCRAGAEGCDDGNPCTRDLCGPGGCVHVDLSRPCDDGERCTVADTCVAGECVGTARSCDDGYACTIDSCEPELGCTFETITPCCGDTVCSDGEGCETCPGDCACQAGTLCESVACVDDACVVSAADCSDGDPCTADACSLRTGCQNPTVACQGDGTCDAGESGPDCAPDCGDGQCTGGPETSSSCPEDCVVTCGDGVCDAAEDCTSCPADCGCPAGDACGTSRCVAGACQPVPLLGCNDGVECTTDRCDPLRGCVNTLEEGASCCGDQRCDPAEGEDGTTCAADCSPASCCGLHAAEPGCVDGGCQACVCAAEPACCSDGWTAQCAVMAHSSCAGSCLDCDLCGNGFCGPTEDCADCPADCGCEDYDACTDDVCAQQPPGSGSFVCRNVAVPECCGDGVCEGEETCRTCREDCGCDDGDACTTDRCRADGTCTHVGGVVCEDGDLCSVDTCDPDLGCVSGAGTVTCSDDGNACTDGEATCDPDLGCAGTALSGVVCNDGDLCTIDDVCTDGVCGGRSRCDDGDPCTQDICRANGTCAHPAVDCDDGNPCTAEMCDPTLGCIYEAEDPVCLEPGATCVGAWCYVEGECGDGWCDDTERHSAWPASGRARVCNRDCPESCYGDWRLCDRTLGELTLAGTHNSDSSFAYGFAPGSANQNKTLTEQLDDGIRALSIDIDYCVPDFLLGFPGADEPCAAPPADTDRTCRSICLCHGDDACEAGFIQAEEGLGEIVDWLERHPTEVVSIGFESYVSTADMAALLEEVGMMRYLYRRPRLVCDGCSDCAACADHCRPGECDPGECDTTVGTQCPCELPDCAWCPSWDPDCDHAYVDDPYPYPWSALVARGQRLVIGTKAVFDGGESGIDAIGFATEDGLRPWDEQVCSRRDLGFPGPHDLYRLAHTRSVTGLPELPTSICTNTADYILEMASICEAEASHRINIIFVDFYDVSSGLFEAVNNLNGVDHLDLPYEDRCVQRPNLVPCVGDAECESGICEDGVCAECERNSDCGADRYCGDVAPVCFERLPVGSPCVADEQCLSRDCHSSFCADCRRNADCAPGQFCDDLLSFCRDLAEAGEFCVQNDNCASGTCGFGYCRECDRHEDCGGDEFCDAFGICRGQLANGEVCTADRTCESGACQGVCAECATSADCDSGEFCNPVALTGGFEVGSCAPELGIGAACLADGWCQSGVCLGVCSECENDADCSGSNFCDLSGLVPPFECEAPRGNGSTCVADANCSSGHCFGLVCAQCEAHADCNEDQYCDLLDFDLSPNCRARLGNGSLCGSGDVCSSGNCCGGVCKNTCDGICVLGLCF